MATMRWLANRNSLGRFSGKVAKAQDCPKCGTCQCAKQTRKPVGTTRTEVRPDKIGGATADGQRFSKVTFDPSPAAFKPSVEEAHNWIGIKG